MILAFSQFYLYCLNNSKHYFNYPIIIFLFQFSKYKNEKEAVNKHVVIKICFFITKICNFSLLLYGDIEHIL